MAGSPEEPVLVGILDRVQEWARAADQKIEVLIAIQALVCGFIFDEIKDWIESSQTSGLITFGLFLGTALLLTGVGFCLYGLSPRVKSPKARQPGPPSVTFFGTIAQLSLEEYRTRISGMDAAAWANEYTAQIHVNSNITLKKHEKVKQSVIAFAIGLAVIACCYVAALNGY